MDAGPDHPISIGAASCPPLECSGASHMNLQKSLHCWAHFQGPQFPLLCTSWVNPQLSMYAQLFRTFDCNTMLLAPPGIWVLAHEKPNQCEMWSPHGTEAWYMSLAMDHYCCYTIVMNKANATRIMHSLEFSPVNYKMPTTLSADLAIWAAIDLLYALCTHTLWYRTTLLGMPS